MAEKRRDGSAGAPSLPPAGVGKSCGTRSPRTLTVVRFTLCAFGCLSDSEANAVRTHPVKNAWEVCAARGSRGHDHRIVGEGLSFSRSQLSIRECKSAV